MAWLDPEDDTQGVLVGAGLLVKGARQRYNEQLGAVFEGVGVTLSSLEPDRGGWDEDRGRGRGRPEQRVVEQARGDRNRALFVE
jgi:hypothetical protein